MNIYVLEGEPRDLHLSGCPTGTSHGQPCLEDLFSERRKMAEFKSICEANDFSSIADIQEYFLAKGTFKQLHCPPKISLDLLDFVKEEKEEENHPKDLLPLKVIHYQGLLSLKLLKFCIGAGWETLGQLKAFYKKYGKFPDLLKGVPNNQVELTELCKKNSSFLPQVWEKKELGDLTQAQTEELNACLPLLFDRLSVRARKKLGRNILKGALNEQGLRTSGILNRPYYIALFGFTPGVTKELQSFIKNSLTYAELLKTPGKLTAKAFIRKLDLEELVGKYSLSQEILESGSIVRIAHFLVQQEELIPREMLTGPFRIYTNSGTSGPSDIGKRNGQNKIFSRLLHIIQLLKGVEDDLFLNYGIDRETEIIDMKKLADPINAKMHTQFSAEFLWLLFGSYLEEDYDFWGRSSESWNYVQWKNFHFPGLYLVRKEVAELLDLKLMIRETRQLMRGSHTYSLNFSTYITQFLKKPGTEVAMLLPVAEKILFQETGCRINSEGRLVLREAAIRPKRIPPLSLLQVRKFFQAHGRLPYRNKKKEKSLYDFYEKKKEAYYSGTLNSREEKQILLLLSGKAFIKPLALSQLREFVEAHGRMPRGNKKEEKRLYDFYRRRKQAFNAGTLSDGEQQEFLLLQGNATPKKPTLSQLREFVEAQGRLPSGKKTEERRLYKYYSEKRKAFNAGTLSAGEQKEFLLLPPGKAPIKPLTLSQIGEFVAVHGRLPSGNIKEEKRLYIFYWRREKAFQAGTLGSREQKKFLQLRRSAAPKKTTLEQIREFVAVHGRLPSNNSEEGRLYKFYWRRRQAFLAGTLSTGEHKEFLLLPATLEKLTLSQIRKFVAVHGRLPSNNSEEGRLYKFYWRRRQAFHAGTLSIREQKEFLLLPGSPAPRIPVTLSQIREFVAVHGRLPRNKSEEGRLYKFYWRRRQAFHAGTLNAGEQKEFLLLLKVIALSKQEALEVK